MSSDEISGGCVTVYGASGGDIIDGVVSPPPPSIAFSNGRRGVYLTIDSDGEMKPGPGLSASEATQAVAKMLVEQWARAYGQKLRLAEEQIEKAEAKARRAEGEMLVWKKAAQKVGVKLDRKVGDDDRQDG